VQTLADATGGACELVAPNEGMAERIVRHFKRIYYPKAGNVTIRWPVEPDKNFPERISAVYDGDTLHVFGRFRESPEGEVELRADLENGGAFVQRLPLKSREHVQTPAGLPGTTARMAAMSEIRALDNPRQIAALGVKYQLMSRFTNCLAIDVKAEDEKAGDLPALRKTPQMLAAGWGGAGTVQMEMGVRCRSSMPMGLKRSLPAAAESISSYGADALEDFELEKPDRFIDRLDKLQTGLFTPLGDVTSISDLEARGVPEELIDMLKELVEDSGADEKTVVTLFLYLLSQQKRVKKKLDRSTRRALVKAYKQLPEVPDDVQQRVSKSIATHLQYMGG
jgi:Ca-activated chloride channel homolog